MKCMNCGSKKDVIDFVVGNEKLILCVDCRVKLVNGELGKVGRPAIGVTKKVSLTLSEETWEWLDEKAEGNRSKFLREIVLNALGNESEWSNYACLGYAIKGLEDLNYPADEIKKIVRAISSTFDMTSVLDAEKIYTKSPY